MPFRARTWVVAALVALTVAFASAPVDAHGQLVRPQPTFSGYGGGYPSIIQTTKLKAGESFVGAPDTNAASFDAAFKAAGKSSLKDFILTNQDLSGGSTKGGSAACGFSNPNGAAQSLPDTLQWGTGFIHPGPCEAWCDGEIVVPYTANCWKTFASGAVPYSKAKCAGKKQLTFYWLAVHGPPWQVYINCVPLSGSGGVAAEASTGGNSGASTGGNAAVKASTAGNTNSNNSKSTTSSNNGGNSGATNNNRVATTNNGGSNNKAATSTTTNNNGNRNANAGTTTNGGNNYSNMGFGMLNNNNGGNAGTAKKNLR
ncbi:hypothetical protein Gpo141_00012241 [Globisporangium polare]